MLIEKRFVVHLLLFQIFEYALAHFLGGMADNDTRQQGPGQEFVCKQMITTLYEKFYEPISEASYAESMLDLRHESGRQRPQEQSALFVQKPSGIEPVKSL